MKTITIRTVSLFLMLCLLAGFPTAQAQAPAGAQPAPAAPTNAPWIANQRVNDVTGGSQEWAAIAIGGDGARYVLWESAPEGGVRLSHAARGSEWGASEWVGSGDGTVADLAADGAGNVYALWRSGAGTMFAARSVEGVWSAAQNIGGMAAIGADDAGNLHAGGTSSGSVVARYRAAGGGWSGAVTIWTGEANTAIWDVDLAVTAAGDAYLTWLVFAEVPPGAPPYGRVYAAYRPAGGAWGGATLVHEIALPTTLGLGWLAADAAGDYAHVTWWMYTARLDAGFLYQPVRYARGSGAVWETAVEVPGTPLPEEQVWTDLTVGADDQGAAYVCWVAHRAWEPIRCIQRGQNGAWGAVTVASDGVAGGHWPHLAVRGDTVHLVWHDSRQGDYDVYYSSLPKPFLRTSSSTFIPQSDLAPGHTLLLYSATAKEGDGNCSSEALDLYLVVNEDLGHPLLMKDDGAGATARDHADFKADDGHHSLWFQPTEATAYIVDLYAVPAGQPFDERYWVDALRLEPRSGPRDPRLAVLTDLRELYEEFDATVADSAGDDQDGNCIADYYDAVEKVRQYAEDHEGLVVDVRQSAYSADHEYTSGSSIRQLMGVEINSLVYDLPRSLQYLALIGDDAVLPFHRLADPKGQEKNYLPDSHNVPTVIDTQANYMLTDVAYSTWGLDTAGAAPYPALGVGRIFYDRPLNLAAAIDAYEKAVVVGAQTGSAFVFNQADDSAIHWQDNTRALAIAELQKYGYTNLTRSTADLGKQARLGWLDAQAGYTWDGGQAGAALSHDKGNRLTLVNSHANHLYNRAGQGWFTGGDFPAAAFPGAVLINAGCHSGYTTGYDASSAQWNYYNHALARAALDRHLTYYAPTTYGYLTGGTTIRYHNLVEQEFLLGLVNKTTASTGLNHRWAVYKYYKQYNPGDLKSDDLVALYGLELYGLPTQPIRHSAAALTVQRGDPAARPGRAANASTTVSLEVPEFRVTPDGQGHTLFEAPHGGRLTAQGDGPLVPLLIRSFHLPANTTDLAVTLAASDTAPYPGSVELPPQQRGSASFGVQTVPYAGTDPYPTTPFWTTVYTDGERTELTLSAIPLRYDPATGQATLIHRMDFQVTYNPPATGVQVEGLVVNGGAPVAVGQAAVPISLTVTAASTQPLTLLWTIEDQGAAAIRSGTAVLTPTLGSNEATWNTDSLGWLPGPMVLQATLADGDGTALASGWQEFTAQGRSLLLSADEGVYGAADAQALLRAEVRDETGAEAAGLAGSFAQTLDGGALALTWQEGGSYTATLDLTTLPTGAHILSVTVGNDAAAQVAFGLDREPPTSTLSSPATAAAAFTVTLSGGDDLSGVEAFQVQYRLGSSGPWTDWRTVAAGWDYVRGEPADLALVFGPAWPTPLRFGATYEFRVQAVDRAGNQEAAHPAADAATTYTGPDYKAVIYLPLVVKNP